MSLKALPQVGFIGNSCPGGSGGAVPVDKIVYFETDWNTNFSELRVRSIPGTGSHRFPFSVPNDFSLPLEAYIEALPLADFTDEDIDLISEYAGQGENFQTHAETNTTGVYSGLAQKWGKLDVSSVLSSLSASDVGGLQVDHNSIGTTVYYGRLVLRYR